MIIDQTPQEFFDQLLQETLLEQSLTVSDGVRIYLVRTLVDPASGRRADVQEPLTDRWLHSVQESVSEVERIRILRSIGEDVLLLCGFWWQRVHRVYRQALDPMFHIGLGQRAYYHLEQPQFTEIADKFPKLIDVFIMMGDTCLMRTPEDIIRLLELWRTTHSAHAAKLLADHGIPVSALRPTAPS